MESVPLLDRAGRRRSPATTSSFHQGVPRRNKGRRYPPEPPTVDEIIAVIGAAGHGADGLTLRGVIVMLWRAGLRIRKRLCSTRPTSTPTAAPCSSGTERATSVARSEWTAGPGHTSSRGGGVQPVSRRVSASDRFHHVVRVGVRIVEAGVVVRKVPNLWSRPTQATSDDLIASAKRASGAH